MMAKAFTTDPESAPARRRRLSAPLALAAVLALAGCFSRSQVAMEYYEQGDWEKANKYLREAILNEPESRDQFMGLYIETTVKLSEQYANEGRYDSAFEVIKRARQGSFARDDARLRQANIDLYLRIGRKSLKEGNIDWAVQQVEEIRRIDPANESARRLQGDISLDLAQRAFQQGDLDTAFQYYFNYLEDYPQDKEVRLKAAETLLLRARKQAQRNQTGDALKLYADALKLRPNYEEALDESLRLASKDNNPRSLAHNYTQLLEKIPNNGELRVRVLRQLENRVRDYVEREDPAQARFLLFSMYGLDTGRDQRLDYYKDKTMEIARFSVHRGAVNDARYTLSEASREMPALAEVLAGERDRIQAEHENFFRIARQDLNTLEQLERELRAAIVSEPAVEKKRNIRDVVDQLKYQQDALELVTRQQTRAALDRAYFDVPENFRQIIKRRVDPGLADAYMELLRRYQ